MVRTAAIDRTCWGEFEIRGPVHLFRERMMLRRFLRLLDVGRVLDAGCGSGSMAMDLCRLGFVVEAVEKSAQFVDFVRELGAAADVGERLVVRQGSVTCLEFQDESFDGLVCGEVLEHIEPAEGGDAQAVAEFYRVLRPGAPLCASVPHDPKQWDHSDVWAGHVKRYSLAELRALFEDGGFYVEGVHFWGFPLARLYHRFLFGPWLRRNALVRIGDRDVRSNAWVGRRRGLVQLAAGLLRFDELFAERPWGRGMVLWARKET